MKSLGKKVANAGFDRIEPRSPEFDALEIYGIFPEDRINHSSRTCPLKVMPNVDGTFAKNVQN